MDFCEEHAAYALLMGYIAFSAVHILLQGHPQYAVSLLGRLLRFDLIKLVSNVCPYFRPYVHPSTKSYFDFNTIWYVSRGRRLMHDGMQYDPIEGQGQGHEPLKVGNSTIFRGYLLPHL